MQTWRADKREVLSSLLGICGLFLFSFSVFFDIAQANQGLLLMVLGLLIARNLNWNRLRRDPMLWLSAFFLFYLVVHNGLAILELPFLREAILEDAANWPIRGFFSLLILALWFARNPKKLVPAGLVMMLAGFLVRILVRLDWANLGDQLHGFWVGTLRATFGYSAVNLGTWAALALWGLVFYSHRWVSIDRSPMRLTAGVLTWLPATLISLAALLFSQSRAAWFSALVTIPVSLTIWIWVSIKSLQKKMQALAGLVLLGMCSVLFLANLEMVHNRFEKEMETIAQVLSSDAEDLPVDSTGLRVRLYKYFWESYQERPVLGWGNGTTAWLLSKTGINECSKEQFHHYHSSYFNALLEMGIVGFVAITQMFGLVLRAAWQRRGEPACPTDLAFFVTVSLVIFGLCALVADPLTSSSGGYFITSIGAATYCWRLKQTWKSVDARVPLEK